MKRTYPTGSLLALALALALPATAQPPAAEPETDTGYGIQGEFEEEAGSDPFDDPPAEADPWSEVEAGSEESFDSLSPSQDQDDAFAADPAHPQDAADIAPEPADAEASASAELKDGLKRMFVGLLMPAVERRVRKAVEGDDAPQSDPVPQSDP